MAKPKSQNPESTFKKPPLTTKCRKLSDHSKRTSGARGALGATPRTRHGTFTTIKQKPALRDRKVSPPSQPGVVGLLCCWVLGFLDSWVVGLLCFWVVGLLGGLVVCWLLGCWVVGLLGWWVVGLLSWIVGLLVCWFVALLVCWSVGLLLSWFVGFSTRPGGMREAIGSNLNLI